MMEEAESNDTYVSQLREVFDSCDSTGSGSLSRKELLELCEKLHLVEHADILVHHLFESESEVRFEDFKECFVAILTEAIPGESSKSEESPGDPADQEVSPKFTFGRKKYGRRSRPASVVEEDDDSVHSSDFSRQNSVQESSEMDVEDASGADTSPSKRPMSPSTSHQPPPKTGRMTCDQEPSPTSPPDPDKDRESDQSFDSSPVQYLQETWKKLGIGQSGYLNVDELALVCEHIGMDMTEEVVAQLFEKLDCDQDGQISFDEFLQGLFQHGDPQASDNDIKSNDPKSLYNDNNREDRQISNSSISGMFSSIDPDNTGYSEAASVLELWESLELPCSAQLLEELGFSACSKINLSDLTSALEEMLCSALNRPVLQLAYLTFQNEVHFLRQSLEGMRCERERLRSSVEEANSRAVLLAQEVDDNHARLETSLHNKILLLERKYAEQVRGLQAEAQAEREAQAAAGAALRAQMQREAASLSLEDAKLREAVARLQQENIRLEQELHEMSEKHIEAEKLNGILHKELLLMPELKEKLAILESHLNEIQEKNLQNVQFELERHKKTNQELQDKIDELTLEIENMHQSSTADVTPSKSVSRNHSWLSDYKKTVKRRGSGSSSEEVSDAECLGSGKWRRIHHLSNGNEACEVEVPSKPFTATKPGFSKGSVDMLLRDMMLDKSALHRKLQVSEEKRLKAERALRTAEHKNKFLHEIVAKLPGSTPA